MQQQKQQERGDNMLDSDEKQKALDGEMAIVNRQQTNEHDRTYENEGSRDHTVLWFK